MHSALAVLLCLLGTDISLKSPDTAAVGVAVLVDADESADKGPLTWETSDPHLVIYAAIRGGRQARIERLKPGLGRFTVSGKRSSVREAIYFTGDGPQPAPAPAPKPDDPAPDVEPSDLPDGTFKIARGARDKAKEVKVARAEQRRKEAALIAGKLTEVRDKIKSGELDSNNLGAMQSAYRGALASLPEDVQRRWHGWGLWWGAFLRGIYIAGKLAGAADWILILEETILGLKAVI